MVLFIPSGHTPPHVASFSVDDSDIFFFFCSGRGKGESEAPGGGGDSFLLKIPGGGGPGGGARAGRVSAANLGILEAEAKHFFFGAETSTKFFRERKRKNY